MDDSESEALRLASREAQQPFDLGQASLMRVKLLRLAEDEHILLLMMHHIISDEWSIGVLLTEIGVLYEAFTTGRNPALPDLPVQYGDFAVWQQKWLQGEAFQKQLSVLETTTRRHPSGVGPSYRSAPTSGAELPGRQAMAVAIARPYRIAKAVER